jgi:NAD(P)-dependent dehydrogenase (short-subunit alcohol dehydrogenase family)
MDPVVLITGVSGGIGQATAVAFAKGGARLVLGGRNEAAGARLAKELGDASAVFRRTDVTRAADLRALVGLALERFGRLDVAVNNAGVEARGKLEDFDEATYARVFDTNVKGLFFAIQAEAAAMRRSDGGSIVNLSSTFGSRGMAGMSLYVASKHAVEGITRAAALELASDHIRVNAVAPGPTDTAMLDRLSGGAPEAFAKRVPLGRLGTPEDVAQAIVWVASETASFVNGAVIPVNGGISAT